MKDNLTIKHKDITLVLSVVPIAEVHPHEEVLPDVLEAIRGSLKKSKSQLDPVIVDRSTGVALDGMHRIEALRTMGASKVLVCKVDYASDSITLGRWLRAYEGLSNPLLEDLKVRLNLTRVSTSEALSEVEGHRTPAALFAMGMSFKSLLPFNTVRESIELVRVFDQTAARSGIRPRIVSESEARRLIASGAFVFVPPPPSKQDVVNSGLKGLLFPPKSTRHLIPARPVGISVPLGWLVDEALSSEGANAKLSSLISRRRIEALPARTEYMGRVYEEPLYRYAHRRKAPR